LADRHGAILERGKERYRIPDPLFSIIDAVHEFRAADTHDDARRFATLARLQELFPEDQREQLRLDPYMRRFRVFHATAFSLHLETTADQSFQFDPVVFGRHIVERVQAGEETAVSEHESLLPPHLQAVFARQRFPRDDGVRDRYAVEGGVYVYLGQPLKDALAVVHKVQRADPEMRKRFARSPQLYIRDALGETIDEQAIETIFIETEQYSERVVDVGLWEPPVLPWIGRDPNDWLPERFGVQIGEKYFTLQPEDLRPLRSAVEEAIERGERTVRFGDEQIPATRRTLDSLARLIGEVKPATQAGKPDAPALEDKPRKHVLIVGENFERLDYARRPMPHTSEICAGVPAAVLPALKPHQTSGLAWLEECWNKGSPGALLADDMGLGKTLQALGFMAWLRAAFGRMERRRPKGPFLVVAPTGLLANWIAEHDRHLFEPGLGEVCRAYGRHLSALRNDGVRDIDTGVPALDHQQIRNADWVLTTYETLRDYHMSFAAIPFACAVFDEMQKVKNPASLNTRAAKTVNADFILGLTGTPIENQLEDLWSIMDIIDPGRLGDLRSFSSTYRADDLKSLEKLRAILLDSSADGPAPILRRLKADHLEGLPQKLVHMRRRSMPEAQAHAYAVVIARAKSDDAGSMLETLHQLRGVSLHPAWPQTGAVADPHTYILQSARLMGTFEILDRIAQRGEKALIFLESLDMQDRLALIIKNKYKLPKQPMQINGEVSGEKRQKAVDEFQQRLAGFDVMILSPKAGSVGLTLTAANQVIHLSRWWNPAVEDQCTDRIYRIGQDQAVNVYYPMAIHPEYGEGSFDALLNGLLERKRDLGRRMLIPPVNLKRDEAWSAENLTREAGGRSLRRSTSRRSTAWSHSASSDGRYNACPPWAMWPTARRAPTTRALTVS
jgi:SNF2-related domain/Helicase conserved C-terminal domain